MQTKLGRSPVHLDDLKKRYRVFNETFATEGTRTLTTQQIEQWLWKLELSHQSVNNFRSRLCSLCKFAVKQGYMDKNPVSIIEPMKLVDGSVEILTVDELAALLAHASPELLPVIAIGGFAGVTTAELIRLNWNEIDLQRGFVEIKASKSKTASRRLIRMQPCLKAWLAPYADKTGPVFTGKNVLTYLKHMRTLAKKRRCRNPAQRVSALLCQLSFSEVW